MQILVSGTRAAPVLRPGRPRSILHELAQDDALVSFQGLRRRLGLHPEALRRALRRLEEDALVEAEPGGYRATQSGRAAVALEARPSQAHAMLHLLLPPGLDAEKVAAALAGRWFGRLHWYGRSDGPQETSLTWIHDGRLVHLRVRSGAVTIEAEGAWGHDPAPIGPLVAALAALL